MERPLPTNHECTIASKADNLFPGSHVSRPFMKSIASDPNASLRVAPKRPRKPLPWNCNASQGPPSSPAHPGHVASVGVPSTLNISKSVPNLVLVKWEPLQPRVSQNKCSPTTAAPTMQPTDHRSISCPYCAALHRSSGARVHIVPTSAYGGVWQVWKAVSPSLGWCASDDLRAKARAWL